MKLQSILSLCFFTFLLWSCTEDDSHDFIGSWELQQMVTSTNDTILADDLDNPLYHYNEDKTYKVEVSGIEQNGTWELKGDSLVLIDNLNPEMEMILLIEQAKNDEFFYMAGTTSENMTSVHLKRKK